MKGFENYDAWKLDNGEPDYYECEHCEAHCNDDEIEETTFRDADGDKRTMFLCQRCIDNEIWV